MAIIKRKLPPEISESLQRQHDQPEFNTYYIIDNDIYIHTEFYADEADSSLTLVHDMALIEQEMIKHMKSIKRIHIDENLIPYYALYDLGLWFFNRIPSKDWVDLLGFLKLLKEHEKMTNWVQLDNGDKSPN